MKKAIKIPFVLASITILVSCGLEANPDSTALMTAINYEAPSRIVYSRDDAYPTPNGKRVINKGDYKPVFSALQDRLGINMLEHQAAANSGDKKSVAYFRDNWMTKRYADMSMGTVYDINNYSTAGSEETILDLKPYIEETKFIKGPDPHRDPDEPEPTPEEYVDIVDPEHKGSLPNIALFLHKNPGVMMSIVTAKHSHPEQGAIYYVPYFDGFNDLEKGTVLRADYTKRLLDDNPESGTFSDVNTILGSTGATYTQHFEPCYVVSDGYAPEYDVEVPYVYEQDVKVGQEIIHYEGDPIDDNQPTIFIHKNSGVPNIIKQQNGLIKSNNATSSELAKQFRKYIDDRYGKPKAYGGDGPFDHYSDLFLAYKACYDTDELVALMRLVKVSSGTLFGKDKDGKWINKEMITMMPRLCDNQRASDLYRWAGQTFGVRGLESRNGYLYINGIKDYSDVGYGKYGAVHDARGSDDMLYVLKKLRNLYEEGLILQNFDDMTATGSPNGKFADETLYSGGSDHYASFMLYDYPNDMNDWNKYRTSEKKQDEPCDWITHGDVDYPYDLRAVVGAVAKWDVDGDGKHDENDKYLQFTESLSSVKTSALCLNADLPKNEEKLNAAFKLIDFIYSDEGMFLYNFGPYEDGYITEKAGDYTDGKLGVYSEDAVEDTDYIEYQGERFPCLTEEAKNQHDTISGLQRERVGATIPFGFNKLKVVPYQTYHLNTKHGVDILNKAFELGTMKHVLVGGYTEQQQEDYKIPFYQICPSTFFLTKGQSSAISSLLDKNTLGSMFTDSSTSNFNIWDSLIMGKETRLGVTLENYLDTIRSWKVGKLESYYQDAFEIMTKPMETITK